MPSTFNLSSYYFPSFPLRISSFFLFQNHFPHFLPFPLYDFLLSFFPTTIFFFLTFPHYDFLIFFSNYSTSLYFLHTLLSSASLIQSVIPNAKTIPQVTVFEINLIPRCVYNKLILENDY